MAGSGAADGVPEGGVSAVPDHHDGDGAMSTAMAISGSTTATFLTCAPKGNTSRAKTKAAP